MHFPQLGADSLGNANSSFGHVKGISAMSVDRWRQVINDAMVRCIEYHCGPEMINEGYAPLTEFPVKLDDQVRQIVLSADRETVSWRSDSGHIDKDLDHEERRWSMLCKDSKILLTVSEIRQHFLFQPYFRHLQSVLENHIGLN